MSTDAAIEAEIQAKGLVAPRITPADVEAAVKSEHYFTALEGVIAAHPRTAGVQRDDTADEHLRLLTFCVLVLNNGFTVTGESACASPENFDAGVGRKIARQNAVAKIWPLEGYLLKQRLSDTSKPKQVIYRSAIDGTLVSKEYAEANPHTTVRETR